MSQLPEFDFQSAMDDEFRPVYFTGEMVFPFMLESYSELRKVEGVAKLLAEDDEWSMLYDVDQLAKNEVPVYAAVYTGMSSTRDMVGTTNNFSRGHVRRCRLQHGHRKQDQGL